MITFNNFKQLETFKDFLNAGEQLTDKLIIPKEYYKKILYFFEEPAFTCVENKTKLINIMFDDNDIVTYIVKYNQIGNNKIYKLSNILFSKNYNFNHIVDVIEIIFQKIPSAIILMHEQEIKDTALYNKKNIVKGYENYFYSYDKLFDKIQQHKTTRHWEKKYKNNCQINYYNNITDEAISRINIIYNNWFNTHPNPRSTVRQEIDTLFKHSNISLFILKYGQVDIGFTIGTIHDNEYFCSHNGYDLSRIPEYYDASLFMELYLCKYLKEHFNIYFDYVYGYSNNNLTLRNYKEKWSDGKIVTYKIDKNNLEDYLIILDQI